LCCSEDSAYFEAVLAVPFSASPIKPVVLLEILFFEFVGWLCTGVAAFFSGSGAAGWSSE